MRRFLIAINIGLSCTLFSCSSSTESGNPAPEISSTLVNGQAFTLSSLKGNYVLIDFWGTWCGPCRAEAPRLVSLYNTYNNAEFSGAAGFIVVSIAVEKSAANVESVSQKLGYIWPHQIVEESQFVMMADIASSYGVIDLPAKFLVDPQGNLIGQVSFEEAETILNTARAK